MDGSFFGGGVSTDDSTLDSIQERVIGEMIGVPVSQTPSTSTHHTSEEIGNADIVGPVNNVSDQLSRISETWKGVCV